MNNLLKIIFIILLILSIFFVIYHLNKDNFSNNIKILKAPECAHAGLGDRIGEYIIFSTLGKVYNCDVLVTWNMDNVNGASRGNEYPRNIQDYIKFPKNLRFVHPSRFKRSKLKNICDIRWKWKDYYFGDELVPEIVYKKLNLSQYINLEDFIKLYKETASQISYKKKLPKLPENFIGVHIRRGDKTKNISNFFDVRNSIKYHDDRLNFVFKKLNVNDYILCSEDSNPIKDKKPILVKLSKNSMIRTLEEFFILTKAKLIIQSIPGDTKWGGWTSFSYIASRIGDSKLYNCSPNGTRIYYMEDIIGNKLYNIIKYSDLNLD